MKIDLRTPPAHPVPEIVKFAQRCEEVGFSGCGYNDAQMYFRDNSVVTSQVLLNTKSLRVHPAVTCLGPKHSSVIASSAKTVAELAPGRYELWLGRGDAATRMVGLPQTRVDAMREHIIAIRRFMDGEWDVYPQIHSRLHHGGGPYVPIYLAANGPKSTRLAGELCDGILMGAPATAEGIKRHRQWLAEGAARAGRDSSEVYEILQLFTTIRETTELARRAWAPRLAAILATKNAQERLRDLGVEYDGLERLRPDAVKAMEVIRTLYPDPGHVEDQTTAISACEFVPSDLLKEFCEGRGAVGDPEHVLGKLKELRSLGVNHVYFFGIETFQLPEPELRAYDEVIRPGLEPSN